MGRLNSRRKKLPHDQIKPVCQRVGKVGFRALAVEVWYMHAP